MESERAMPGPDSLPIWVYVVAMIVLPIAGWLSRDWKERLRASVEDRISVRGTQGEIIKGLQKRVAELEQRLDDKDTHYQQVIRDITSRYDQRATDLQQHIDRLERELRAYQDDGK